jgi:predicted DsbA family dithiol-disulfide isomerase
MPDDVVQIAHFSDTLCIWAYVSQIRVDECKNKFGDQVRFTYHYIPVYGDTRYRIGEGWKDKGNYLGYIRHLRSVADQFPQVGQLNPDIWVDVAPVSSQPSHLFLKAVQFLEADGVIDRQPHKEFDGRTLFEETAWRVRREFFANGRDIAQRETLFDVGRSLKLPLNDVEAHLDDGTAMAALARDRELQDEMYVRGSPTYVLNESRQILYGNVGYRILEANIKEVMDRPEGQATWC